MWQRQRGVDGRGPPGRVGPERTRRPFNVEVLGAGEVCAGGLRLKHEVDWDFENADGYSFNTLIRFGDVLSGEELASAAHPAQDTLLVGSSCGYAPQTDAVIAGQLEATATTGKFDTPVSTSFTFQRSANSPAEVSNSDGRIGVERGFNSGDECTGLSSDNYGVADARVQWDEPFSEGEARTHEFFLILHDYFSPKALDGDVEWLRGEVLVPNFGGSNVTAEEREDIYGADTSGTSGITLAGQLIGDSAGSLLNAGELTVCQFIEPSTEYGGRTADGEYVGFEPDVMRLVADRMGVTATFVEANSFDALARGLPLDEDQCDVLAAQISITPERSRLMAFSAPYRDGQAFAVDLDNEDLVAQINDVLDDDAAMGALREEWFGE